jgi:Raf kinase inhibitor-like YbhB/YbcL family protein
VHDPHAPTGGAGWGHWIVVNIPAGVTELPKNAGQGDGAKLPPGAMNGVTGFGTPGYGGPCPPKGARPHHYHFTLYALKIEKLDVPKGATASLIGYMANANSIGTATLTGKYGRPK